MVTLGVAYVISCAAACGNCTGTATGSGIRNTGGKGGRGEEWLLRLSMMHRGVGMVRDGKV